MSERLIVYTTVFNDYDTLRRPKVRDKGVRYVCITDRDPPRRNGWEIRLVETPPGHPYAQRSYKILSDKAFPEADLTLYIDGNLELLVSAKQLVKDHLEDADIALCRHPERVGVYAELDACAALGKDRPHLLSAVAARYRRAGVPEEGFLYAGGMILRRHSAVVAEVNRIWFEELLESGIRDQPALVYALWKTGTRPSRIDENIWHNDMLTHHPHKAKSLPKRHGFLFVGGNPRSGTTALGELLNTDPRLIVGMERYRRIRNRVTPEHFTRDRFLAPTAAETNFLPARLIPKGERGFKVWPENEELVKEKWDSADLALVGDKAPFYVREMPYLRETFPRARFIMLLRDPVSVADSYQRRAEDPEDHWPVENDHALAVTHWNESIAHLQDYIRRFGLRDLFLVDYDAFYSGDVTYLRSLYRFLELDIPSEVIARFKEITRHWAPRTTPPRRLSAAMVQRVRTEANWDAYIQVRRVLPLMRDYELLAADRADGSEARERREKERIEYQRLLELSRTLYAELESVLCDDEPDRVVAEARHLWQAHWTLPEFTQSGRPNGAESIVTSEASAGTAARHLG